MSTLMLIRLSVNIKSTFILSLKQPFFKNSEPLSCPLWLFDVRCRWSGSSVPVNQSLHLDVELLFALCLPQGLVRGMMPNLEALQVCHDYNRQCVCVSALSKHTAGSPSPNLFTQVRQVVKFVCVCVSVCFYHHGAHLSSLPSTNLEGRV